MKKPKLTKRKMTIDDLGRMIEEHVAKKEDIKNLATKEDLSVLKEDLSVLKEEMSQGFKEVDTRFDTMAKDIRKIDERLTRVEVKVDVIADTIVKGHEKRIVILEQHVLHR